MPWGGRGTGHRPDTRPVDGVHSGALALGLEGWWTGASVEERVGLPAGAHVRQRCAGRSVMRRWALVSAPIEVEQSSMASASEARVHALSASDFVASVVEAVQVLGGEGARTDIVETALEIGGWSAAERSVPTYWTTPSRKGHLASLMSDAIESARRRGLLVRAGAPGSWRLPAADGPAADGTVDGSGIRSEADSAVAFLNPWNPQLAQRWLQASPINGGDVVLTATRLVGGARAVVARGTRIFLVCRDPDRKQRMLLIAMFRAQGAALPTELALDDLDRRGLPVSRELRGDIEGHGWTSAICAQEPVPARPVVIPEAILRRLRRLPVRDGKLGGGQSPILGETESWSLFPQRTQSGAVLDGTSADLLEALWTPPVPSHTGRPVADQGFFPVAVTESVGPDETLELRLFFPKALADATKRHNRLQNLVGSRLASEGWRSIAGFRAHALCDLAMVRQNEIVIVEVKTLSADQSQRTHQVRLGVGQVLDYRARLRAAYPTCSIRSVVVVNDAVSGPAWQRMDDEAGVPVVAVTDSSAVEDLDFLAQVCSVSGEQSQGVGSSHRARPA